MKTSMPGCTAMASIASNVFRAALLTVLCLLFNGVCLSQVHRPVTWTFGSVAGKNGDATLNFTARLDDGWHLYSQFMEGAGPLPTKFHFAASNDYQRVGGVTEEYTRITTFDETFQMEMTWFKDSALFLQKVKLNTAEIIINGSIEFMVCTDEICLPPEEVAFAIKAQTTFAPKQESSDVVQPNRSSPRRQKADADAEAKTATNEIAGDDNKADEEDVVLEVTTGVDAADISADSDVTEDALPTKSLWNIFLLGIAGGLMALVMPCIFPMLPFTIGYFAKQSNGKRKAIAFSAFYGLSIIAVYVALGLLVTVLFGSDALNALSTNGIFNLFFFLLLMLFAASFLGAFELTLPSSWVTAADRNADRRGLTGIFFMAITLSLVSFSCTGPIIGTLLVEAAVTGKFMGPAMGMFGFALALATPFTFFSMFPTWLKALPKSGGWLNSIKVVLGFLEVALALKFLSNVDLAYHWGWLDREVFVALWIIIFALMGLYLLGKLKLSTHDETSRVLPLRLFLAIITLAFAMYMVPGLWGAPLKAIAAFLPPQQSQDFDLYSSGSAQVDTFPVSTQQPRVAKKYGDLFHAPFGLDAFFDYDEGLAYAREVNKPVIIDFTGHACVNCRKMEAVVWSDPRVLNRLRHDYVLVQLYVDDKTALADGAFISRYSGRTLTTIGNKWSDLQAGKFGTNAQPYYVLVDGEGEVLAQPRGADYDAESFARFLDDGLERFRERVRM